MVSQYVVSPPCTGRPVDEQVRGPGHGNQIGAVAEHDQRLLERVGRQDASSPLDRGPLEGKGSDLRPAVDPRAAGTSRGGLDPLDDAVIAGAPAEVACHQLPDRVRGEQLRVARDPASGHDDAGRARAALRGSGLEERLQPVPGQSLDRPDLAPVRLVRRHEAGVDGQPVEQHRAGAAFALAAPFLGARQIQPVSQQIEQPLGGGHLELEGAPVQFEGDGDGHHAGRSRPAVPAPPSGPSASASSSRRSGVTGIAVGETPRAASMAPAMAGAGPFRGNSPRPFAPCAP